MGNTAALKHGRWSETAAKALLPEQAETLARLADHESAILTDLGGEAELSTFERDAVRRYEQLDAVADFNVPRLFATRAATRREAKDVVLACVDRQLKIVALLGARRRQRDITDLSIGEYAETLDHGEIESETEGDSAE